MTATKVSCCGGTEAEHAQLCPATRDHRVCPKCRKPGYLHCPGCTACWPDYACGLLCEGDEHPEFDKVCQLIDEWQEANPN